MARPRTVYRGKRKYSWIITLAAFLVVLLIAAGVWLFYDLQRYIVYDKDGLHLDFSDSRGQLQVGSDSVSNDLLPGFQKVDVEIVVDERDYSEISTSAGTDLTEMHAVYVPASLLNENTLHYYAASMGDFDALVLEMKSTDGTLHWHSGVSTADSYAVNGTQELAGRLAELKEKGVYLVAELSALADSAMAIRNAPIALRNGATGGPLIDDDGMSYLDPYSNGTRSYLLDLLTELRSLGFDEVLLTGFSIPDSEYVRYSLTMTQLPHPSDALSSLALWLREQADTLGLKLSVCIDPEALHSEAVRRGQSPELFVRVFDRVAVECSYASLSGDLALLEQALGHSDENRCIAVTEDFVPERKSYIVR